MATQPTRLGKTVATNVKIMVDYRNIYYTCIYYHVNLTSVFGGATK
ncbi:MAG: hypothetical protein RIS84_1325 [Pseudomonadota bacterium]